DGEPITGNIIGR
nr:SNA-III=agglutinin-III [Sambucus nigra L., fruit, Peptide Partial, 12 aa] [Sambucus nigra]